jgi:hypothetical protein
VKQVQAGARRITDAAENGGPMIFARIGMMQAISRHRVPDRRLVQAAPLGEAKVEEGRMTVWVYINNSKEAATSTTSRSSRPRTLPTDG